MMQKIILILSFCFYLKLTNSLFDTDTRIINGSDVEDNEFPFMVSVKLEGNHYCGGTIISKKNILSAAHCYCSAYFPIFEAHQLSVELTSSVLNSENSIIIPVANITCHDLDILEHINDIAILELESEIPEKLYSPVHLVDENFSNAFELDGLFLGWGQNKLGLYEEKLQKLNVKIYNDSICEKSYSSTKNIEYLACAGWPQNGRGTCFGDSGGPLLITKTTQFGIISHGWGLVDCSISDQRHPKIVTRISRYLDWITNNSDYKHVTNSAFLQTNLITLLSINLIIILLWN